MESKPLTECIYVFTHFRYQNTRTPVGLIKTTIFDKQNSIQIQIHVSFKSI